MVSMISEKYFNPSTCGNILLHCKTIKIVKNQLDILFRGVYSDNCQTKTTTPHSRVEMRIISSRKCLKQMALQRKVTKMTQFSRASKIALAAGAGSILFCSGIASAAVVNQGDAVIDDNTMCTVGYVDKNSNSFYTAAHCVGGVGSQVTNLDGESVGTVTERGTAVNQYDYNHDTARVAINPGHTAGDNVYSGDKVANLDEIEEGDTLHSYGITHDGVYSGKVDNSTGNAGGTTFSQNGMAPIPGDSGGPAWVEGKGFVGVATGYYGDQTGVWTMPDGMESNDSTTDVAPKPETDESVDDSITIPLPEIEGGDNQGIDTTVPDFDWNGTIQGEGNFGVEGTLPEIDWNNIPTPQIPEPQPVVSPELNGALNQGIDVAEDAAHTATTDTANFVNNTVQAEVYINDTNVINTVDVVNNYEGIAHDYITDTANQARDFIDTWIPAA